MSDIRKAFEQWIASPPREQSVLRNPDDQALHPWPGQYEDYQVQLAWEAWQESHRQVTSGRVEVNPTLLPELTDEERKKLGEVPEDAVKHWMRGETFDFSSRRWLASALEIGDPKPDEYEFHIRSGFGGDILEETYKCKACGCFVEYTP